MKLVSKSDLDSVIGKKGIFFNPLLGLVYISGISEIDVLLDGKSFFQTPCLVNFIKRDKGLEISLMRDFKKYYTYIKDEDIIEINYEDKDQIYNQKSKSIFGRALAGGLILGPVGAILGGMTGLKDDKIAVKMPDLVLLIKYKNENNNPDYLILSSDFKSKMEINNFFLKNYRKIFMKVEKVKIQEENTINTNEDTVNTIKKLSELKDQGILTEEEFQKKKKELLDKI